MSSLSDQPATQLEVLATQALVTALGKALVKRGTLSGADIGLELAALAPVMGKIDPLLDIEIHRFIGIVVNW